MRTPAATSSEIRAWAREAGLPVGDRGRLSPAVLEAFANAHQHTGGSRVPAATKTSAKQSPAKKTAAKKAPAKATRSAASTARKAPAKSAAPRAVQHEAPEPQVEAVAPVVTVDSELLQALESQVQALAARVESLEAARAEQAKQLAAKPAKGLFRKKG